MLRVVARLWVGVGGVGAGVSFGVAVVVSVESPRVTLLFLRGWVCGLQRLTRADSSEENTAVALVLRLLMAETYERRRCGGSDSGKRGRVAVVSRGSLLRPPSQSSSAG